MVLISEQVHPLSLDFRNQRRVVFRRTIHKEAYSTIADGVRNLQGGHPPPNLVARVSKSFSHNDASIREPRTATPQTQENIKKYTGWFGLMEPEKFVS